MFSSAIERLNDRRDAVGDTGEDAGFTLIELMVVLLILAILLAIAIPTFLGVTKSANDRAAQSNLNTALVNAKSIFQNNSQSYVLTTVATGVTSSMVSSLASAEPNLGFTAGSANNPASGASQISVAVSADGNGIALAALAKGTGNCWYVIDNAASESWVSTTASNPDTAGTWYGEDKNLGAACTAASIPSYTSGSIVWQQSAFPSV
jgi:type IV pilus assembly protein PilA